MGRRSAAGNCCSKELGLNRGAWTDIEDKILTDYINIHGEGTWRKIPHRSGLKRCCKSCRLRWLNYLKPEIKRGNISLDEEDLIIRLHKLLGNRWSLIAGRLPGRTDNEIKNYWNTTLEKKVQCRSGYNNSTSISNSTCKHSINNFKPAIKKKKLMIMNSPSGQETAPLSATTHPDTAHQGGDQEPEPDEKFEPAAHDEHMKNTEQVENQKLAVDSVSSIIREEENNWLDFMMDLNIGELTYQYDHHHHHHLLDSNFSDQFHDDDFDNSTWIEADLSSSSTDHYHHPFLISDEIID